MNVPQLSWKTLVTLNHHQNVFLQELDDDSIKFLTNTAKRHEGQVAEVS